MKLNDHRLRRLRAKVLDEFSLATLISYFDLRRLVVVIFSLDFVHIPLFLTNHTVRIHGQDQNVCPSAFLPAQKSRCFKHLTLYVMCFALVNVSFILAVQKCPKMTKNRFL